MIRKTVLLITGTVAGVVGVVGYNPPQLNSSIASTNQLEAQTPASTVKPTPSSTATTKADTPTPKATKSNNQNIKPKASATASAKAVVTDSPTPEAKATSKQSSGVFQGDTTYTRWGPVQVEITVADGKITNVSTLQYPNGDRRSLNISNQVLPWLQQEALRAQSTNITGISGATYTSNGFKNSLASALQKAGL